MMVSFNRLILIGNLARDPELRYTPQGKPVCELVLAVDQAGREGGEIAAGFFSVTAWEKQAEACAKHLKKGSLVQVEGRILQERWEQEGQKRSKMAVTAHLVNFLSPKAKGEVPEPAGVTAAAADLPPEGEEDIPL